MRHLKQYFGGSDKLGEIVEMSDSAILSESRILSDGEALFAEVVEMSDSAILSESRILSDGEALFAEVVELSDSAILSESRILSDGGRRSFKAAQACASLNDLNCSKLSKAVEATPVD